MQEVNPLEPTAFHESWWLDIATGGRYEVAEVSSGGKTLGKLPYAVSKRFGIRFIEMPMLTHFLGPGLAEVEGSANNRFLTKLAVTRELIEKLPAVSLTTMKMHYGITDAVAFQEQGFRTSVQFTHEIDPLPVDLLWANLRNKMRNVIRKAQERLHIRDLDDPGEFMNFYLRNLAPRGERSFLDRRVCEGLLSAAIERKRGRIIAAYNDTNELLAANFYLWDQRSYYYLLTTRAVNSGNGANSLLVWEAIRDASLRSIVFDADGLNSVGSILFFAGLGGTLKARYIVSRANFRGSILSAMRDAVWGKNYFVRG